MSSSLNRLAASSPRRKTGRRLRGFRLTENDLEILRLIFEFRFARIEHLMALTGRTYVPVHRRVSKLAEAGYLYRIVRPFEKHVFAIGKAALPLLVERGLAPMELLDWRPRHNELKDLFLKHELMVVDLHSILELATRLSEIRLVGWREGPSIFDRVAFSESGARRKSPVRPDALFTLLDPRRPEGRNTASYLLEADRSTTAHSRYRQKLLAFWHYFQQGCQTAKFGIKKFRVVIVTLTPARAWNLCEMAAKALPSSVAAQMFLFSSVDNFSLENPAGILDDIFIRPKDFKDGIRHRLVPPLLPEGVERK